MRLTIFLEGNQIDLFKDEVIELNSSVAEIDDITKISTDYTKTFTIPASENNNQLFKHYYQADIDNTFDSRTKKKAEIKFDGLTFRTGKLRLEKVNVRNHKPHSYTINFWGDLVAFKDAVKNDELSSLDLSAYNHDFSAGNVWLGLMNTLNDVTPKSVIYTLHSSDKQYIYNPATNENTPETVNIAYNGQPRGVIWNTLKPSIRLIHLIEAIETKYNFVFSRDFFSRPDFMELYMWCNRDTSRKDTFTRVIDFGAALNPFVFSAFFDDFNDRLTQTITFTLNPLLGFETTSYKIVIKDNGVAILSQDVTGVFNWEATYIRGTHYLTFEISSGGAFGYNANYNRLQSRRTNVGTLNSNIPATATNQFITSEFNISRNLPKLKISDFLKGIFQMFKLVAIPLPDGTIYINNVDDFYKEGTLYDFTKYIDFSNYDVERGVINNQLNFKYQDPTTFLNMKFLKDTGISYGDELLSLADDEGVPLDGTSLDVTLPFEQIMYERLPNTNIHYGLVLTDQLQPANPKPIIFYNNNTNLAGTVISLIANPSLIYGINTTLNNPSTTLGLSNPTTSINWGVEFSTWDYVAVNNTLFSKYWNEYILSIFNIKKRSFKFKAVLPTYILLKLKLNDIIFIKERYYRINDFIVNLNSRETTLNLTNVFDANFGFFTPSQNEVRANETAQEQRIYVANSEVMNIVKIAIDSGVSWLAVAKDGMFLVFNFDENISGTERQMFVKVDNGAGQEFQIYVNQL